MQRQDIALEFLVPSRKNARKTGGDNVDDLVASIHHSGGILQNLTVTTNGKAGYFEVVAGNRRLQAVRKLSALGQWPSDRLLPCLVVDRELAEAVSLAENTVRESMHPADECEAYAGLVKKGMSRDDVAAQFGKTRRYVDQRLSVSEVSPELMKVYRAGGMTFAQLTAYTITDDHTAQEAHWNHANHYDRDPNRIRRALTSAEVDSRTDRRAVYVGLEAYEAAGGYVRRDLFATENAGWLNDGQLLDQLCTEKLRIDAETIKAEGWSWVETREKFTYAEKQKFGVTNPTRRSPTDDEAAQLAEIEAELDAIDKAREAQEFEDFDEVREAKAERLEAQRAALAGLQQTYSDRQKAKSGAVLYLDDSGVLVVERGLIRPAATTAAKGNPAAGEIRDIDPAKHAASARQARDDADPADSWNISSALVQRLTAQRTAALAVMLARNPRHALVFATHALAARLFYREFGLSALKLSIDDNTGDLERRDPSIAQSYARTQLNGDRLKLVAALPANAAQLLGALLTWDADQVARLFAHCVAHSVDVVVLNEKQAASNGPDQELSKALALDMVDFWHATYDNFFGSAPKAVALAALNEAGFKTDAQRLAPAKAKLVAAETETLLTGSGWLPAILRTAGVNDAYVAPLPGANTAPSSGDLSLPASNGKAGRRSKGAAAAEATKAKPTKGTKSAPVVNLPKGKAAAKVLARKGSDSFSHVSKKLVRKDSFSLPAPVKTKNKVKKSDKAALPVKGGKGIERQGDDEKQTDCGQVTRDTTKAARRGALAASTLRYCGYCQAMRDKSTFDLRAGLPPRCARCKANAAARAVKRGSPTNAQP